MSTGLDINMKRNLWKTLLFAFVVTALSSCRSVQVQTAQKDILAETIENAYQEYLGRDADGTDINAMLSYFPLSLMTNRNSRSTWDDYFIRLNEYLVMAEQEHISQNYSIVAGTNEIFVVSNFFASVISGAKQNGMKFTEVPYHLSSTAQELLLKIHNNEYKKNE